MTFIIVKLPRSVQTLVQGRHTPEKGTGLSVKSWQCSLHYGHTLRVVYGAAGVCEKAEPYHFVRVSRYWAVGSTELDANPLPSAVLAAKGLHSDHPPYVRGDYLTLPLLQRYCYGLRFISD